MKRTKRVLIWLLSVLMIPGFIPVTLVNAETTNYVKYEDASAGDLLYTLNFNFDENFETGCVGVADGTYTVSGDSGERVTFTNATSGGYFYGGELSGYKIKGNIYTVSYYVENSSYSTIKTATTLFENAIDESSERVGIANDAAEDGQMNVFRGSSLYEKLDNTVIRKTDTNNNNRQYFKVVIDGVHGVAQFYALSDSDKYEWLVNIDMDMNAIAEDYLQIGMYVCDAVSAEQAVSMGDVQIYKGNTVVTEKTKYQQMYDAAADGDVLYDVKFVDGSTSSVYTDGWDAFIGNETGNGTVTASEEGNSLTLKKNSKNSGLYVTAAMPDKSAAWYGSFTYEFYMESGSRVGTWFLGNTAGDDNYRMGFSYFNNQYPDKVFMINRLWHSIAEYEDPTMVDPDIFRGDAAVEASFTAGDTTFQIPDTGEDITCNVKVEFDAVNKKMTTYMLKDGVWIKYASLYYDGTTFYPVFGVRNYNKNTTTIVRDFVVKKGLFIDTSVARIGEENYATLQGAINAAEPGDTITLLDSIVYTGDLTIGENITLDLNGKTLTASSLATFDGNVIDSEKTGLLKVDSAKCVFSKTNTQMPVYNGEGYVFATITPQELNKSVAGTDTFELVFKPLFGTTINDLLADSSNDTQISFRIRLDWEENGTSVSPVYLEYTDAMVQQVYGNGMAFSIKASGVSTYKGLTITPLIISDQGAEWTNGSFSNFE